MYRLFILATIMASTASQTLAMQSLGNILPLGDSITRGTVPGGYRERLYEDLTAASYSFRFIGTRYEYPSSELANVGQAAHEGHGGYSLTEIDTYLDVWLGAVAKPSYVLLMAGTNDFLDTKYGDGNIIGRLDTLIDHITTRLPDARLIVSNLTPRFEVEWDTKINNDFNPLVPGLVASYATMGHHVTFVDMAAVVSHSDLVDNAHPTQDGYNKIGDAWFHAIATTVPEPSAVTLLIIGTAVLAVAAWKKRSTVS